MTSTGGPNSQDNVAFQIALQRHRDKWESDYEFPESATPEDLYNEIKRHEDDHRRSKLRAYSSRISDVIMKFEKFFSSVDALVSVNPIAGLAWGGIKFFIRVRELAMCILLETKLLNAVDRRSHNTRSTSSAL